MWCDNFKVMDKGTVIAEHMTLETAIILVKALFENYYKQPNLEFTIVKMQEEVEY